MDNNLAQLKQRVNRVIIALENHMHALSIYFMGYNFVRIHQTLRVTPAMSSGVTERLWDLNDIVAVVDEWEVNQSTP